MARDLRIVTLLPSATEIVCALGATDSVVGISHECDWPVGITRHPVLTSARIDVSGSSREIDTAVRGVVRDALSIYTVDEAMLGRLRPDVIVTQDLCEVCAVSVDDVRAAVARVSHRSDVEIVCLRPVLLADVWEDIERVARGIGRVEEGRALRASIEARMAAIAARAARAPRRLRVASLEWVDPLMLGGTWMPEMITLAGGIPAGVEVGQPSPTIDPDILVQLAPDVVLVKPCGFSLERALSERDIIQTNVVDRLGSSARVYVTDGNAFFNRPGPRLAESLEIMAACVHPELFEDFATKHKDVIVRLS